MRKTFAKLALFTIISIWLAVPLHTFADELDCIQENERKEFIITILEEPFGKEDESKPDYKTRNCCRVTYVEPESKTTKVELIDDACGDLCSNNKDIKSCETVMVILSKGGTTMIEGYISTIYTWAAGLVGLIAVTVIIISGIQIAMSGGDTQAVESGKNRILKSLSGLAVLFLSGLILYTINPNFFTK